MALPLPMPSLASAAIPFTLPPSIPAPIQPRTIWGLDPSQLHTRYWASNGVQVVRQGEPSEIVKYAELFLLTESPTFTLFKLTDVVDALNWIKPQLMFIRLHDTRDRTYREHVVTDEFDQFVRFERRYDASSRLDPRRPDARSRRRQALAKCPRCPHRLATPPPLHPPHRARHLQRHRPHLRPHCPRAKSLTSSTTLVARWHRPDSTVLRARNIHGKVWRDAQAKVDPGVKFIGPVWVGCGRKVVSSDMPIVGPTVIWDDPDNRPVNDDIHWLHIEPSARPRRSPQPRPHSLLDRVAKRAFDIVLRHRRAFAHHAAALPDHHARDLVWRTAAPSSSPTSRETRGGREFPCVKFRSMRKDAEKMKAQLKKTNQADGPQFFMEHDPRLTRVGRFLRKYNFDELPQFWNVLTGDMSIVGPRPSPHKENQYCPPWREARLSVRPGITGLWQVKRTRRAGSDFQEWIRYDLEYVEKRSWWMDLHIIWQTIAGILGKVSQ